MNKNSLLIFLFVSQAFFCQSQDYIGSGRAIEFDGIDDLIEIGSVYHDLNLPFSVSAWIRIDPSAVEQAIPIFVSNDNTPIYRGFWFFINSNSIWCEFGDGTGPSSSEFRQGKRAAIPNLLGKWIHVSAVMKSPSDISLYVNGIDVGGGASGNSGLGMASSYPNDIARIGYFLSNGVVYRFKGSMDEVRLWNRALSQNEVRDGMCLRLNGNEANLIGYWNFDELAGDLVNDLSKNHFHGLIKGQATRTYSGAPLGTKSIYLYASDWTGKSLSQKEQANEIIVKNIFGSPQGIQLYAVPSMPSRTGGLKTETTDPVYFGVFIASLDDDNSFDLIYSSGGSQFCKVASRMDNSIATWSSEENPVVRKKQRNEFIGLKGETEKPTVALGSDISLCDQSFAYLEVLSAKSENTYTWNTGEKAQKIKIFNNGNYWVSASNSCGTAADTIFVQFNSSPKEFSLGPDQQGCLRPERIAAYDNPSNMNFRWQDGSGKNYFDVTDYGQYWLEIKNGCGSVSDTINFSRPQVDLEKIPNVITPNGDSYNGTLIFDSVQYGSFSLLIVNRWGNRVYYSEKYKNDWDGGDLVPGVYFYTAVGDCLSEVKGTVSIIK